MSDATHRCLGIREVQHAIFQHAGLESLPRLARTCTIFKETALNILWRDQLDTLAPLIMVMPADLWEIIGSYLRFKRMLEEDDWQQFDYYARKIVRLGTTNIQRPLRNMIQRPLRIMIDESILVAFSGYRPTRSFLPRLSVLSLGQQFYTKGMVQLVPVLFGPSITELALGSDLLKFAESDISGLLTSIARLCPNIRTLKIPFTLPTMTSPRLMSALETLTSSLHHLRTYNVGAALSGAAIRNLSRLPNLQRCRTVVLDLSPQESVEDMFATSENEGFIGLRDLAVRVAHSEHAWKVVEVLRRSLKTLVIQIQYREGQPVNNVFAYPKILPDHPCASSLTVLHLKVSVPLNTVVGRKSTSDTFKPILAFRNIRDLTIDSNRPITGLDDTWLDNAASSWPHLESIAITARNTTASPPSMTLKGLIPLIQHSPELSKINLYIAAFPISPEMLPSSVSNSRVTKLEFQSSNIENPYGVFRSLVRMFPNIKSVGLNSGWNASDWTELNRLLELSKYR